MDLDKLEALAQAATPGPWAWDDDRRHLITDEDGDHVLGAWWDCSTAEGDAGVDVDATDGAYIAAVDPQTVLQLISALREAERVLAAYGAGDEALTDLMGEPT